MEEGNCIFCDCQYNGLRVYPITKFFFLKFDACPVSKGHALIIPKRHCKDIFELTHLEWEDLRLAIHNAKTLIDYKHHPDGYNIGANCGAHAGQTIFHFHLHVIPRYKGDVENPRGGVRNLKPPIIDY